MKKIIPYIFILAILIGFFSPLVSPVAQVSADAVKGTCVFSATNKTTGATRTYSVEDFLKTGCVVGTTSSTASENIIVTSFTATGILKSTPSIEGTSTGPYNFQCAIFTGELMGCIAELSYDLWSITASVAHFAGRFLDFFIYYSTNSSSYANQFVEKGWAATRDIANLFFIVALIYVAVKTVLSLHGSDSKKLIVNIIIVALIINFSLFATKIIIDGSNMLAKVFYNSMQGVDASGNAITAPGNEKSISIGLVKAFNPQQIVSTAEYANGKVSAGMFAFIMFWLLVITGYTAIIFFKVGLLFVGRVVILWLSMILAPFAFASYAVPISMDSLGHEKWWDRLLHSAFLAPLFIFLLYLILIFADNLGKIISYTDDTGSMQKLMAVTIPFIILMALLKKSKEKAEEYAQEMGKVAQSFGKKVFEAAGLVAIGGGAGIVASGLQGTMGRFGKSLVEDANLIDAEARGSKFAKTLRTLGSKSATGSWDLRKGVVGGALGVGTALTGVNLGANSKLLLKETGGYEADLKRRNEKRLKRAEGLKVAYNEPEAVNLRNAEIAYRDLQGHHAGELEILGIEEKGKRQALEDASRAFGGKSEQAQAANTDLQKTLRKKRNITNGGFNGEDYSTDNHHITEKEYTQITEARNTKAEEKEKADAEEATAVAEKEAAEQNAKNAEEALKAAKKVATDSFGKPEFAAASKDLADKTAADAAAKTRIESAAKAVEETRKATTKINEELTRLQEEGERVEEAKRIATGADGEISWGTSINGFTDEALPKLKQSVHHLEEERRKFMAESLRNQKGFLGLGIRNEERARSADAIRLGAHPEKHSGSHGGGSNFASEVLAGLVSEGLSHGGGDSHAKTTDTSHAAPSGGTKH